MIAIDWAAIALGLSIGAAASAAFFVGLKFGMRLALRTERPVNILVLSAVLRIAALLGIGWAVAATAGAFALAGFALAFFVVRTVATTIARAGAPARAAP